MLRTATTTFRQAIWIGLSATALAASNNAMAQEAALAEAQDEADEETGGNAIVVTARRIEERLQDVPIAVSTLSAQDLDRQSIDDLGDVAEKTVGFAFESFTGPLAQPVIRGQTNLRTTSPVQNVSTSLNGVYIQRGYFVDQGLLDLKRVEIIKGPQSALYGRNAFAGVVSLVTGGPDLEEITGKISGTLGTDERREFKAALSVPIIPGTLAIYAASGYSEFDGTWRNNHPLANAKGAFTRGKLGGYEKNAVQLGAALKLADAVTLEGQYIRTERELESNPAYTISTSGLTAPFNTLNASPTGTGAARQNRLWVGQLPLTPTIVTGETRPAGLVIDPRSYGLRGPSEIWIGKMTLDTGGPVSIQYLYGHTEADIIARGSSQRDPTTSIVLFGTNYGNIFDSSGTGSTFKSDSHEGKAIFDFGGTISGFVGVNLTKTTDIDSNASEFAPVNSLVEPTGASIFPVVPGGPIPTTILFRRNTFLQRRENVFSAFGFIDWRPSEKLSVTLEGRYTEEDQRGTDRLAPDVAAAFGGRGSGFLAPIPPTTKRSASFFTPRGSITYKFSDDNNIYFTVARGYKSGGINGVAASFNRNSTVAGTVVTDAIVPGQPIPAPRTGATAVAFVQTTPGTAGLSALQQTYDAETNWTYEIGSKNQFLDGRLTLNLSAYLTDWKNLQSNAVRLQPDGTAPASFLAIVPSLIGNVGDVRVWGVEAEGSFRLTPGLRVDFGASYNRARYRDDVYSQRFGASGNCDGIVCSTITVPGISFPVLPIGGNQLERTPEFDALLGLNFDTEFSNGWKFFARGDVTYQTKQYADEANLAFIPSRTLVNASLGLDIEGVNIQLWAKNIFDRKYVTSSLFLIGIGGAGSASYVPILGEQRTMGLTASYRF
ncbi:MAG: TonB-dependent receptor [Sphingomonadaceae bacterium]|nr:TonB-dependent receptor [Sphingomonadaceae bacterium]